MTDPMIGQGPLSSVAILIGDRYDDLPKPSEVLDLFCDPYEPAKLRKLMFSATLGMCEMECAAYLMVVKAKETGDTWKRFFCLGDVPGEQTGFLCLLSNGWMETGYPNGMFYMGRKLIERLAKRGRERSRKK